jgi:hypothetical protein
VRKRKFELEDPKNNDLIVSYESAETIITGGESAPGVHETVVKSVIRGLNVLDVLQADEVISDLVLRHDLAKDLPEIDSSGSRFVNLRIAGEPFDVALDHSLCRAAADYARFCQDHPEHPEQRGKVHTSLARHPKLRFEPPDHGFHHQSGFGRIFFCDWHAAPYTQGLTMLRLELGSPATGRLLLAAGIGNGTPYP